MTRDSIIYGAIVTEIDRRQLAPTEDGRHQLAQTLAVFADEALKRQGEPESGALLIELMPYLTPGNAHVTERNILGCIRDLAQAKITSLANMDVVIQELDLLITEMRLDTEAPRAQKYADKLETLLNVLRA